MLHGIICLWKYVGPDKYWALKETYPIDDDGHPLLKKSTEWQVWMDKRGDFFSEPVMGRAVTMCSLGSGVILLDIHPPEWSEWLSPLFYEELRKLSNWANLLERGHELYFRTLNEAQKYFIIKEKP